MSTDTRQTPAQQSTAAATDVAEFITDLDGGQFERLVRDNPEAYFELVAVLHSEVCRLFTPFKR